jgi:uncharacterized membrane protein
LLGVAESLKPERVFLVLAGCFGLAFLVLTPPCQVPDEGAHFYRAVDLSEGRPVARKVGDSTGDEVPAAVKSFVDRFATLGTGSEQKTTARDVVDAAAIRAAAGEREFVAFSNAAVHPPVAYVPQALGVGLARLFSSRVFAWFYVGRLFNLAAATALTYLALRLTPVGKWSFAALALTPMAVFQAASLSADATTNALSFLFVAQVLALAVGTSRSVGVRAPVWLALSGAAIGLAKQAYFLLSLCYVLIPARVFGGRKRWCAAFALLLAATFLAVFAWAQVVRHTYSPADPKEGMDPTAQIARMCSNPAEFMAVLGRTAARTRMFAEEYVGALGLLDTRLPGWLHLAELALLVMVFLGDYDPRSALTVRQAWLAASVALAVGLSVLVIIHVTWDSPGAAFIAVQGRYFIPAGPLAAVAIGRCGSLVPAGRRRMSAIVPLAVTGFVPVALCTALDRVYDRYYVDGPEAAARRYYREALALQGRGGADERVRALYEQALAYDPDYLKAHLQLGQLLTESRPSEAGDHFRAALRLDPRNIAALNNLASLLTRQMEFPEAVRLYREAAQAYPEDASVRANLSRAERWQAQFDEALSRTRECFRALLAGDVATRRDSGADRQGLYLKHERGRVADPPGRGPLPGAFRWRVPPPSGEEIPLAGGDGTSAGRHRLPFCACCEVPTGPKRVFIFPPAEVVLMPDAEVSWYFQVPLASLTPDERGREEAYRRRLGLRFPLGFLPE